MFPSDYTPRAGRVQLLDVTAGVLEELLEVALTDAAPDDVTPPLGETDGWNPERICWFREYHRAAAAGKPALVRDRIRWLDGILT